MPSQNPPLLLGKAMLCGNRCAFIEQSAPWLNSAARCLRNRWSFRWARKKSGLTNRPLYASVAW